jgi:hypothetical protein
MFDVKARFSEKPLRDLEQRRLEASPRLTDFIFIAGLLILPFQVVQIGVAQPAHLWMLISLLLMIVYGTFVATSFEAVVLVLFCAAVVILTVLTDFPRVKADAQLFKFLIIYPGFYFVGRWLGAVYSHRSLPVGYVVLLGILIFEIVVQALAIPVIYNEISFGQGALHGTFKERNWLATYILLLSYVILLSNKGDARSEVGKTLLFVAINLVTMVLTGSKTAVVGCGIIILLNSRTHILLKIAVLIVGFFLYLNFFSNDFSDEAMRIRFDEERGLAFEEAVRLIKSNPLGYGVGFVEAHFGNLSYTVMGLGEGTNSVFSVVLDLMIIAGPVGVAFWLVFFGGFGVNAVVVMAPVAALSLLNPLHQSEFVYFFVGMLISISREQMKSVSLADRSGIVGAAVQLDPSQ